MSTDDGAERQPSFEQALAALDEVVGRLESGAVGLEEAVALFEAGRGHLAICRQRLAASEARIQELIAEDDGSPAGADGPL